MENNNSQNNNENNNDNKNYNNNDNEKKIFKLIISSLYQDLNDEDDNDNDLVESDDNLNENENENIELITLNTEINCIDDLLNLIDIYDSNKKYNINLSRLSKIKSQLIELKNMIGLNNIKSQIINQLLYILNEYNEDNMLHTVITGTPGVGKTKLAKILGDIYHNLNIFKIKKRKRNNNYPFKIVSRSDLIGKYLGHTSKKTQEVIDECNGGVLFIDEAYSLGNTEGRDSFSKECIDTINLNLSEKKKNFLCIIAGYKDSLDKCFFSYNEGLNRRFTFRYNIEPYTANELKLIFFEMIKNNNWEVIENDKILELFENNYKYFINMAGDMESLLFYSKITHSKRIFFDKTQLKKLNFDDIKLGLELFLNNRNLKENEYNDKWKLLYI